MTHFFGGAETVNDVYSELVSQLLFTGSEVGTAWHGDEKQASSTTRELHPVAIHIDRPYNRIVSSWGRPVNVAFAMAEVLWILAGRDDVSFLAPFNSGIAQWSDDGLEFNAAYGKRLRSEHGYDQLDDIIRTLMDDPDSRQATMSIWHPKDRGWLYTDSGLLRGVAKNPTRDKACNVVSHAMIRDGKLDWVQVMRSNDLIWGTPYNWIQWISIQEYVARAVGVRMGSYTHIVDSLHVYERHLESAKEIHKFDIYDHVTSERTSMSILDTLRVTLRSAVAEVEAMVKEPLSVSAEFGSDYWMEVIQLLRAHRLYVQKDYESMFVCLEQVDQVWQYCQLRFYYAMRWYNDPNQPIVKLMEANFPPEIMAWIKGERNA